MPLRLRRAPGHHGGPGLIHAMRTIAADRRAVSLCGRNAEKWTTYASHQPHHVNCGVCLELMEAAS